MHKKQTFSLTVVFLIISIFLTISNNVQAQNAPSETESEISGIDNYDVMESNITYNFNELNTLSVWNSYQYPHARFYCYDSPFGIYTEVGQYSNYPNFMSCEYPPNFGRPGVKFVQLVHNVSFSVVGGNGGTFKVDIYKNNQFSQTVTFPASCGQYTACLINLRQHNNVTGIDIHSINDAAGLGFDDFSFALGAAPAPTPTPTPTPTPNQSPSGILDRRLSKDNQNVTGWSHDPNNLNVSNAVKFYIDGTKINGTFAGQAIANVPKANFGNHGFEFSIPVRFRDGNQHTIYAYGQDITAGNSDVLLTNSPVTFSIRPEVQSVAFQETFANQLSVNENSGGGLRIFPEKQTPTAPVNNKLMVKAKISPAIAGVPVYLYAYDLDDPSSNQLPIDDETALRDNRSSAQFGDLCPTSDPTSCQFDTVSSAFKVLTDSNGEVSVPYTIPDAYAGDNFAVVATTNPSEISQIAVDGINLRNTVRNTILQVDVNRTKMLTVWRKLHIEVDTMGVVQYNLGRLNVNNDTIVDNNPVTFPISRGLLEPNRFQNGRMLVNGNSLNIISNTTNDITVNSYSSIFVPATGKLNQYSIFDDDDFNSNVLFGYEGDNGEDVTAINGMFNLMQENSDRDCGDGFCNVYAAAYILPEFSQLTPYNSEVSFDLNTPDDNLLIQGKLDSGRYNLPDENDDYWVAYIQIDYQSDKVEDCDPDSEDCATGYTLAIRNVNDVRTTTDVPRGSQGSLTFVETMKDVGASTNLRIKTVPHEIGHQFGISGDESESQLNTDFGLMGYRGGLTFIDRHLNILRWRRRSPGF